MATLKLYRITDSVARVGLLHVPFEPNASSLFENVDSFS